MTIFIGSSQNMTTQSMLNCNFLHRVTAVAHANKNNYNLQWQCHTTPESSRKLGKERGMPSLPNIIITAHQLIHLFFCHVYIVNHLKVRDLNGTTIHIPIFSSLR